MTAAEAVPQADSEEHERREAQGVGVDDPLQFLDARTEGLVHDGQCVGDHEVVQCGHEDGERGRHNGQPNGNGAFHDDSTGR